MQGGHGGGGVGAPRGGQVAQQAQRRRQAFRAAAQIERQHPGLSQVQGGAHGLIVVGGDLGGVASGGLGAVDAGGGAAAAGVLAPQGGGAQGGVEGAGAGDAACIRGLLTGLDLHKPCADQLQPAEIVAVARLLEQPSQISAEFEHGAPSSRFGITRVIRGSSKQTQRRSKGSA